MIIVEARIMKLSYSYSERYSYFSYYGSSSNHSYYDEKSRLLVHTLFHAWEELFTDDDLSPNLRVNVDHIMYNEKPYLIVKKIGLVGGNIIYRIDYTMNTLEDEESFKGATAARQRYDDRSTLQMMEVDRAFSNVRHQRNDEDNLVKKLTWWQKLWRK
jgi:hypothetical protein